MLDTFQHHVHNGPMTRLDDAEREAVEATARWLAERDGLPPRLARSYLSRAAALLAGEKWAQIEGPIRPRVRAQA